MGDRRPSHHSSLSYVANSRRLSFTDPRPLTLSLRRFGAPPGPWTFGPLPAGFPVLWANSRVLLGPGGPVGLFLRALQRPFSFVVGLSPSVFPLDKAGPSDTDPKELF
jgi:hypothetical protein